MSRRGKQIRKRSAISQAFSNAEHAEAEPQPKAKPCNTEERSKQREDEENQKKLSQKQELPQRARSKNGGHRQRLDQKDHKKSSEAGTNLRNCSAEDAEIRKAAVVNCF